MKKVVVTGVGVVSSVGFGRKALSEALHKGNSGIKPITSYKVPEKRKLGGMVEEISYERPGRAKIMLQHAFQEALHDAKLSIPKDNNYGLLLGTMASDTQMAEEMFAGIRDVHVTPRRVKSALLKYPMSSLLDVLAYRYHIGGPRMVATNACASSNIILGYALDLIRQECTDTVFVCGAEALKETMFWGAEGIKILGPYLKAFDLNRSGTVLGEGAGVLVLESEEKARSRNVKIYAELAGYGISCDEQVDMIIPQADGEGFSRAIHEALKDAQLYEDEIDYVNAHGTGTVNIDRVETIAIKQVFGERAYKIPISSTKTVIGHTGGAGGLLEAITTVIAIDEGFYPPTLHYETPDPELDLDYVTEGSRPGNIRSALSNNMGGGGVNSVVAFAHSGLQRGVKKDAEYVQQVVVTGLGVLSPQGTDLSSFLTSMRAQYSREQEKVLRITDFDIEALYPNKKYQMANRAGQYILAAAKQACEQAQLQEISRQRIGVLVGTAFGGYTTTAWEICTRLKEHGPNYLTPYLLLNSGHNLGASLVARECNVEGMYSTITTGSTAGLDAIGYAMNLIRTGRMDAVVVGAVDIVDTPLQEAYQTLGLFESPLFRLGEGAGIIILESLQSAESRNAEILGELNGYGCTGAPVGRGQKTNISSFDAAVFQALKQASWNREDIDVSMVHNPPLKWNLHSSIPLYDPTEHFGEAHAAVGLLALIHALGEKRRHETFLVGASAWGGTNSIVVGRKWG